METIYRILLTGNIGRLPVQNVRNKNGLIAFVWIVHIAAMIGVSIGFQDWFVTKTPLNLLLISIALILFYPFVNLKEFTTFIMIAIIAFYSEWLGVHFGWIFGDYSYGQNLGWKIEGVPFLISMNWAVLVLITATLATRLVQGLVPRVIIGSLLMVFLDIFMEPIAPRFDYWEFAGGSAPILNYIGWFGVACLLQTIVQKSDFIGDVRISLHLYVVQLIFFAWFNVQSFL